MKRFFYTLTLSLFATCLFAQKPALNHSVYDDWKSLSNSAVSASGNYVYYTVSPQEGDGYTELKYRNGNLLFRADRGSSSVLTENEAFFIVRKSAFFAEKRAARIKKKKADDMPKDSLLVYAVKDQVYMNYGPIVSYKLAEKSNEYIAFVQEAPPAVDQDSTVEENSTSDTTKNKSSDKTKKESLLLLANLSNKRTVRFQQVDQYHISPNENFLVFTKKYEGKDSLKNDILHIYDIKNDESKVISYGKGTYKGFTFDEQENQLVFLADKSPEKSLTKNFKVYYYNFQSDTAQVLLDKDRQNIPQNWYVSGDGNLRFDRTGDRLLFGLAPIPPVKDTSLVEFEHAVVDIWHWQDETLMPQQLANLKRDLAKNYDAIYSFSTKNLTPLQDKTLDRIVYTDSINGDWALASSAYGNKIEAQWQGYTFQKLYLISLINGERKLIKENFVGQYYLSPNGDYVLLYDSQQSNWLSYDIKKNSLHTLNEGLVVSFANEEHDMPIFPGSYGIAGWDRGGAAVYLNDRYDVWYFDLEGGDKYCLTDGFGRKNQIQLRIINTTKSKPRQRTFFIEPDQQLLLSSFNIIDKRQGLFSLNRKKKSQPSEIVQGDFTYANIMLDEQGNNYIYTKENYTHCPDLYISVNFADEQRLTDINPQQKEYNWGTAELVKWKTPQGYDAEGILYKPENFDPSKKYPIIAYFYETLTEGLYRYQSPAPTPSRLNIPYFVSNEYLVFCPDIRYEIGHPGKSAEEYVNSGMRYLGENPWVDTTKMAIQGQSWGGYQVAHLITRTGMYAAAWSGAPVVNMTSAYGGIRWTTGMSRQFQYENTQSRIGQNLWENRELYIENSPLFFMDKVMTPVVIMSNDNDGAVPWYQGIEMFTALRRLGKPSWLLNYNNDEHNLVRRQNRKDIQIRQSQFFDHFLKGKDAPKWMKSGVSATDKGVDWGFD